MIFPKQFKAYVLGALLFLSFSIVPVSTEAAPSTDPIITKEFAGSTWSLVAAFHGRTDDTPTTIGTGISKLFTQDQNSDLTTVDAVLDLTGTNDNYSNSRLWNTEHNGYMLEAYNDNKAQKNVVGVIPTEKHTWSEFGTNEIRPIATNSSSQNQQTRIYKLDGSLVPRGYCSPCSGPAFSSFVRSNSGNPNGDFILLGASNASFSNNPDSLDEDFNSGTYAIGLGLSDQVISTTPASFTSFPVKSMTANQGLSYSAMAGGVNRSGWVFIWISQNADQTPYWKSNSPVTSLQVGQNYSYTFEATGGFGTPSYSFQGLIPTGLSFDEATGLLSGTVTTFGTFPFTVSASNAQGSIVTNSLSIVVFSQLAWVNNSPEPALLGGSRVQYRFHSSGYPAPTYSISAGQLPTGMTLSESGLLSGYPENVPGNYPVTISASNGLSTSIQHEIVFTVSPDLPGIEVTGQSQIIGVPYRVSAVATTYSHAYTANASTIGRAEYWVCNSLQSSSSVLSGVTPGCRLSYTVTSSSGDLRSSVLKNAIVAAVNKDLSTESKNYLYVQERPYLFSNDQQLESYTTLSSPVEIFGVKPSLLGNTFWGLVSLSAMPDHENQTYSWYLCASNYMGGSTLPANCEYIPELGHSRSAEIKNERFLGKYLVAGITSPNSTEKYFTSATRKITRPSPNLSYETMYSSAALGSRYRDYFEFNPVDTERGLYCPPTAIVSELNRASGVAKTTKVSVAKEENMEVCRGDFSFVIQGNTQIKISIPKTKYSEAAASRPTVLTANLRLNSSAPVRTFGSYKVTFRASAPTNSVCSVTEDYYSFGGTYMATKSYSILLNRGTASVIRKSLYVGVIKGLVVCNKTFAYGPSIDSYKVFSY